MSDAGQKNFANPNVVNKMSSEMLAREIADSGAGLHPTSKIRDAIYSKALTMIRALRNTDPFYEEGPHG